MNVIIPSVLVAALLPAAGFAQTAPTAFAERSQIIGTDETVHLYSLSTKDSAGKIQCFDVAVDLGITNKGQLADTAAVTSAACPKVKAGSFVPGDYQSADGRTTCSLVGSPFAGRTELDLYCTASDGRHYTYTWYTGPIKGSPIEPQLDAAGLNTLPNNQEYSWGRITRTDYNSGCTYFGNLFGAREVAGHLDLNIYGNDSTLDCTSQYVKTTP